MPASCARVVCLFVHSFVYGFVCLLARSFLLAFVRSFACSLVRLFVRSFSLYFGHSSLMWLAAS